MNKKQRLKFIKYFKRICKKVDKLDKQIQSSPSSVFRIDYNPTNIEIK
jgi:hypothetical protein